MATDYTNIDEPYNTFLERSEQNTGIGNVETQPVKSDGAMSDVWIKNFIRSEGWRPKTSGFYINGQTGYAEFSNVYVSGNIQALTGSIGGFVINSQYIEDVGDSFGLSSEGTLGTSVRLWAGATFANRASAPFRVLADGTIAGSSITVSAINLPDTTTVQSFHVQNNGNSWWGANLAAGYAAAPAYVLSTGAARFTQVEISGSSTLGGTRLATTVGSAINASGDLVNDALGDLINSKLNTQSQEILQDFDFGTTNYSGGIKTGNISWNSGGWVSGSGVVLCRNGIIGANGAQVTFTINALTGAASFKGSITSGSTITGASFSAGTIVIGSGASVFSADTNGIYLGNTTFAFAPFRVTAAGIAYAKDLTIESSLSALPNALGRLRWTGGSRIWEDNLGDMGVNAIGGQFYVYCNSSTVALFQSGGGRSIIYGTSGLYSYAYLNSGTTESIYGANVGRIEYNAATYHYKNIGGNLRARFAVGNFTLYNSFFNIANLSTAYASSLQASAYDQDGSMYYNTTTGKLRVRIAGSFRDVLTT